MPFWLVGFFALPGCSELSASSGNMQRWRFLIIRDPKIKETVGAYHKRAWDEQVAPRYRAGELPPGMSRERFLRLLDAAGG